MIDMIDMIDTTDSAGPSRHAIFSRRVLTPEGTRPAAVVIEDERIVEVIEVSETENLPEALPEALHGRMLDLGELTLMPGLVDCHVHINQPGRTHWEGFHTATRAAAAGGVTTLVDMPLNCLPVTTTVAGFERKLADTPGELWVDLGFWGGVIPGNADQLGPLAARGVLGCKAFLCDSGIEEFPASDEAVLREAMTALAAAGLPLLAHAEIELETPAGPTTSIDPRDYHSWLDQRPPAWEEAAIDLLIALCRETGCAVHIVHLSAASAVPALRRARAEGLPITVETCPHYLCLSAEEIPAGATQFKCAPPVREAENREALWDALREGVIDLVVTDHSPCTPELKSPEAGDFLEAWGGIASLSLGFSSVWTQACARGFSLAEVSRWMSSAPARIAGLDRGGQRSGEASSAEPEPAEGSTRGPSPRGRKGRIAPGFDADLVALDPDAEFTVRADALHFRHRISPWIGRRLRGVVHGTWLRGRRIFDASAPVDACFCMPTGTGRPLLGRAHGL